MIDLLRSAAADSRQGLPACYPRLACRFLGPLLRLRDRAQRPAWRSLRLVRQRVALLFVFRLAQRQTRLDLAAYRRLIRSRHFADLARPDFVAVADHFRHHFSDRIFAGRTRFVLMIPAFRHLGLFDRSGFGLDLMVGIVGLCFVFRLRRTGPDFAAALAVFSGLRVVFCCAGRRSSWGLV